jgi:hypothetical protein
LNLYGAFCVKEETVKALIVTSQERSLYGRHRRGGCFNIQFRGAFQDDEIPDKMQLLSLSGIVQEIKKKKIFSAVETEQH